MAALFCGFGDQAFAQAAIPDLSPQQRLEKNAAYAHSETFRNADRNHDGRLDREEFLDRNWGFYLTYDVDGDGKLSMAEFIAINCYPEPAGSRRPWIFEGCVKSQYDRLGPNSRDAGFFVTRETSRRISDSFFRDNDRNHDGYMDEKDHSGHK